jgi:hypothetical protein
MYSKEETVMENSIEEEIIQNLIEELDNILSTAYNEEQEESNDS